MVASIGAVAAPSQGAHYYEADGYYAKDSPEHLAASAWAGKGAEALGLEGPVNPDTFKAVLEGEVPDGSGKRLGRRIGNDEIHHRPGRDLTFSAPKSVSLAALVGGDGRIVEAHADDDLGAAGTHRLGLPARDHRVPRLAAALGAGRLGADRANVSVRHRPEPLDDVFLVGQAGSEEMHQKRVRRVAGHRHRCRHGVASVSWLTIGGGDALPRARHRRPAYGRTPPLRGAGHGRGQRRAADTAECRGAG